MNRLRAFIPALFLGFSLLTFLPVPAEAAANLPGLDPNFSIVPELCQACPCGYVGVLQLIQNLMNAAIAIGVIAFVIVFAYAGIMFMVNPTNPEMRSKARGMLINVMVGMIIVLAAWLVVDFIMKTLYKDSSYGPWNSILTPEIASTMCIESRDQAHITGLAGGLLNGIVGDQGGAGTGGSGGGGGTWNGTVPSIAGSGACNAATLQSVATQNHIPLSPGEANTFACLAHFESACGARNTNYNWGNGSSAAGAFQVTLAGNSRCLDNPICERAARVTGPLNCSSGFRNGNPIPGNPTAQNCLNAISNMACSLTAAHCVHQAQSYLAAWAVDPHGAAGQRACIAQYGGGN